MDFANKQGFIWFNGELVNWADVKLHFCTHTLHYGMGVFEGIRAYKTETGPAIFKLTEHTKRLFDSAKIMQMKIPYSEDEINAATLETVKKNNLESAYIRPLVFYGSEGMGLRADNLTVNLGIAAWEWGAYMGAEALEKGIKVKTSSYTRHHVNITMTKAKSVGSYMNSILALQEALNNGADEALLLDPQGYVAEGSGENIFIIKDNVLYTPYLNSALNGITRTVIFELAQHLGYEVKEKNITRDEVYIADEAFFTGTAAEITPIASLDDREIGRGQYCGVKGSITSQLQSLFFKIVTGNMLQYSKWLSY